MNRRSFIKSVAAATASTFIVPGLILPAEPEKRFWALGGLPEKRYYMIGMAYPESLDAAWPEGYHPYTGAKESNGWTGFPYRAVVKDRETGDTLWIAKGHYPIVLSSKL